MDPKAREVAKELARRSGMSLGEWLDQMLKEEPRVAAEEAAAQAPVAAAELSRVSSALDRLAGRLDSAEHRSTLAISGIDQSVNGLLSRLEAAERGHTSVAARFEQAVQDLGETQARTVERLGKLEEEVAAPKQLEALRALEAALERVAAHLYDAESRTRDSLEAMRADLDGLGNRVESIDAEVRAGANTAAVEGAVTRIIGRLEAAEQRTSTSIQALETSFTDLDRRMRNAEQRNETPEQRLEELADALTRSIDGARAEMNEKIEQATTGRFDAVERSLQQMSATVQQSEQRSSRAIERMGEEVARMAGAVDRRVGESEMRSAAAIGQVGGEISRVADAMEQRLRRADSMQAESLEKLGAEITRITERLAERIANAERRSAQAIDDVGEQVSRVTERINQGHERAAHDLAERIRASEERTARLLDEAREKLDRRLSETHSKLDQVAVQPQALARQAERSYPDQDLSPGPFGRDAFGPLGFSEQGFDDQAFGDEGQDFGKAPSFGKPELAETGFGKGEAQAFEDEVFEPSDDFGAFGRQAPASDQADDDGLQLEPISHGEDDPTGARATTRELIAQARASARAASTPDGKDNGRSGGGGKPLFSFMGGKKQKGAGGSTLKTALLVSAAMAALGVGAVGGVFYWAQTPVGSSDKRPGQPHLQVAAADSDHASAKASAPISLDSPTAALALSQPALPAQPAPGSAALYADAVRRIESHDLSGVADLRKAANLAYAPAQFYLARLYESGESGVKKDLSEARRWTERAAQNGDRKAMHNLGLYYFEGTGGPKNTTVAAQWFRKAADLGLVDSQYNLARLYEEGFGVGQNLAEAYKWYLIASRSGDLESTKSADRVKRELSPDAQATAARAASSFHAQPIAPALAAVSLGGTQASGAAVAQKALSKMGYYHGPTDGSPSPALKPAIAAYQRDQGMAATGTLDQALLDRFSSLSQ